jgi:hypothetical protein
MGNLMRRFGLDQPPQDPKLKVAAIEVVKDRPRTAKAALASMEEKPVSTEMTKYLDGRVAALGARMTKLAVTLDELRGVVSAFEDRLSTLEGRDEAPVSSEAATDDASAKPWVGLGISRSSYFAKKKAGEL